VLQNLGLGSLLDALYRLEGKSATRRGAKGASAPPLAKSKLRKKAKISDSFGLFCFSVI